MKPSTTRTSSTWSTNREPLPRFLESLFLGLRVQVVCWGHSDFEQEGQGTARPFSQLGVVPETLLPRGGPNPRLATAVTSHKQRLVFQNSHLLACMATADYARKRAFWKYNDLKVLPEVQVCHEKALVPQRSSRRTGAGQMWGGGSVHCWGTDKAGNTLQSICATSVSSDSMRALL